MEKRVGIGKRQTYRCDGLLPRTKRLCGPHKIAQQQQITGRQRRCAAGVALCHTCPICSEYKCMERVALAQGGLQLVEEEPSNSRGEGGGRYGVERCKWLLLAKRDEGCQQRGRPTCVWGCLM